MNESSIDQINETIVESSSKLLVFAVTIVIGVLVVRLITYIIKKFLKKSPIQHTIKTFIFSLIRVILYSIVAITALGTIGVNVSSLLTALGAAALTAGLAVQDSLKNFVSGIIILVNKPFVAGDILEFENITGSVESINVFYTTLRDVDEKLVRIPNSRLTSNNVTNCTMENGRKMFLRYTVSYEDDVRKVKKVVYNVVDKYDKIVKDPAPVVCIGKHLDSGVEVVVKLWVNPNDYFDVYYYMQEHIKIAFDENGITIPYPHIVVKNDK